MPHRRDSARSTATRLRRELAEHYIRKRTLTDTHRATVALVQRRGHLNFVNQRSCALYAATRTTALDYSLASSETPPPLHILRIEDAWNPALTLHNILCQLSSLKARMSSVPALNRSAESHETAADCMRTTTEFHACIASLDEQTLAWPQTLPSDWHPVTRIVKLASTSPIEEYISLDAAALYNKWRCARLQVLQLRYTQLISTTATNTPSRTHTN